MGAGRGLGTGPSLVARARTLNAVTLPSHILFLFPRPSIFFFSFNALLILLVVPPASAARRALPYPLAYSPRRVKAPRFASAPRMYSFLQLALYCTMLQGGYPLIAMSTAETFSSSSMPI